MSKEWPLPKYDQNVEPHFLFLITPPNSGSTAMANILNTSHRTMILRPNGEGQGLVPGLFEKDRWDEKKFVNYDSVKAVWLRKYQDVRALVQNIDVVIEKSPPNMMRIEKLASSFQSYSLLANIRDPYATCASILCRYNDVEKLTRENRLEKIRRIIGNWVLRIRIIQRLVLSKDVPLVTYEIFCDDPQSLIDKLKLPEGVAETMKINAEVKIKDYDMQKISNQNQRQIAKLERHEIEFLTSSLSKEEELISFFGYELLRV